MRLRQKLLQLGVLCFQLLQTARLRNLKAAILRLPAVKALFRDPVPPGDLLDRPTGLPRFAPSCAARRIPMICSSVNRRFIESPPPLENSLASSPRFGGTGRLADRQADLLPVPYFHVVFTVPAEVAAFAFHNEAVVYVPALRAFSYHSRS